MPLVDQYVDNPLSGGLDYGGSGADGYVREAMCDQGLMRPFKNRKGQACVTVNTGWDYDSKSGRDQPKYETMTVDQARHRGFDSPVLNATTLRKLEWQLFDRVIIREARNRLRAWADLAAANTFGGFDGMSKTILEHETMSDPGEAVVDMDALTPGRSDRPRHQLEGLPLPITHCDFWFSERELRTSRNTGTPLDTTMAEAAARRVAEKIEDSVIGLSTGMSVQLSNSAAPSYGRTVDVYGYTDFPSRNTYTSVTTPTGSNPNATVSDVLAMIDAARDDNMYGPFMLYHSNDWDQYLDNDYAFTNGSDWATNPSMTLRQRLNQISGIMDVRRLDRWTPASSYQLLLVQMTTETARAVIGMNITTVQWESTGGLRKNFKVMGIMVPEIRATFAGNCGIVHGTTS